MLTPQQQAEIDAHYREQNAREEGRQEAVESCAGDPAEVHKFTYPVLAIDQAYSEALKRMAQLEDQIAKVRLALLAGQHKSNQCSDSLDACTRLNSGIMDALEILK